MIISRGRGYIFVHIPKTGGTSLATALENRAMKDDILIGDTPKAVKRRRRLKDLHPAGRLWKHSTLRDIAGVVGDEEFENFFVFTIVRNPWDRVLSYYSWLKGQSFNHPAVGLAANLSFAQFLAHPQIQTAIKAQHYASYVTDAQGVERCSLYLRLEQIDEDLARLEEALDMRIGPLPKLNPSDRSSGYREAYSRDTRAMIERVASVDIERFGYQF
ncbi:MAG: sulfotransferase family 2 domain-containing protein [Brevirhabdus sp.]